MLGLVTWDDYEEGTELETGIDNCMQSVDGSVSGNTLSWNPVIGTDPLNSSISGDESTVHHYTVFISQDGQNLMVLQDNIASGTHSLDLSQYNIPPGTYTLYVKAVGQPSVLNHMSNAISYTASGTGGCMVSLSSPANGSTVSSPVRVTASATPTGSNTITSMEIDVDGSAVYQAGNANSVDQAITMSSGNHAIAVKATDSS